MDFYAILGVSPAASTSDIKRAYRRLARRYHPGVNPGDRAAEERYRQIAEAYETLVDPRRRQEYDAIGGRSAQTQRMGSASLKFTEFDFSVAARGAEAATFSELFADVLHPLPTQDRGRSERGADLHAMLTVDFVDAVRGVERPVMVTRQVACGACGGAGQMTVPEGRCAQCQGTGAVRWARGHMVFSKSCTACGGSGRRRVQRCAACGGYGRTVRSEAVTVAVPPGIADGTRLRVAERGHAGRDADQPGDLYVTVQVRPHEFLRMENDDLVCVVPVAVHEAVLGARIEVPTPDGPVKLRVPPGTQGGRRFRLAERGPGSAAGSRGDLVVEIRLVLPDIVDERSKELMREFGQRNNEDVRKGLRV